MKRQVWIWQLAGFSISSLLGTLLHFLYDFTGGAVWAALFSGVNESTFEHIKLLFWPMLAFAVIESFFFRERKDFWCIKLCGILLGLVLIPILFYTYNGVIGKSPDFVNIAIFFVSAAIAYIFEAYLFRREKPLCSNSGFAVIFLCIIAILLITFTFRVPDLGIFKDTTA